MAVGDQPHAPASLPPGKSSRTHCRGGWVVLIVAMTVMNKKFSCPIQG